VAFLYETSVSKIEEINKKVLKVTLSFHPEISFRFQAGQFVSVKVSGTQYRTYSVCSDPKDVSSISLLVAVGHEGVGSKFFKGIKAGDTVSVVGPAGRFTLPSTLSNTLVFVATGTGIAPFLSMFHHLRGIAYGGRVILYFGIRNKEELLALDELKIFRETMGKFEFKLCMSASTAEEVAALGAQKGRVTSYLDKSVFPDAQFFLCGNPSMVSEVFETLVKNGVPQTRIFHEKFTFAQSSISQ
jgi:ferredoxin-NADP reductase